MCRGAAEAAGASSGLTTGLRGRDEQRRGLRGHRGRRGAANLTAALQVQQHHMLQGLEELQPGRRLLVGRWSAFREHFPRVTGPHGESQEVQG